MLWLVLALALLFGGAYFAFWYVFRPWKGDKMALAQGEQYAPHHAHFAGIMKSMAELPCEEVCISSFDGTALVGRYYHLQDGAPLEIQFHGYHGSPYRDFCGGHYLARKLGHNTLVVEQRAHGDSAGKCIAFGIYERRDCLAWVRYARKRFGEETPIFLSGVSMGAATVLMASGLDLPETVAGILADSPYDSPKDIICKVSRDMGLPPALAYPFVALGARLFGGFDPGALTASQAVQNANVPLLIVHGTDDRFVPCEMSEAIAAANPLCERHTFPGAGHGLAYMEDAPRYEAIVAAFTRKCLKNFQNNQAPK